MNKQDENSEDDKDQSKRKSILELLGLKKKKDANNPSISAEEIEILKSIHLGYFERNRLFEIWKYIIGKGNLKLQYKQYLKVFKLKNETWIRRTFEIMNINFSGDVSFLEFIKFCTKYLIIDQDLTEEFSFRLVSRRGSTFMANHSILDVDDIINFVSMRYPEIKSLPKQRKLGLEIFSTIDTNGDGGIEFIEFQSFCRANACFLKVSHRIQNHLRRCIFGIPFWVNKSRKLKYTQAKGLDNLSLINRINMVAESYTRDHILDPVVDFHGNPLTNESNFVKNKRILEKLKSNNSTIKSFDISDMDSSINLNTDKKSITNENNEEQRSSNQLISPPILVGDHPSTNETNDLSKSKVVSFHTNDALSQNDQSGNFLSPRMNLLETDSRQQSLKFKSPRSNVTSRSSINDSRESKRKSILSWNKAFSISSLEVRTFAEDFPEIVRKRHEKKNAKREKLHERRQYWNHLATKNYEKLIIACSDLVFHRRGIRKAFNKWLETLGLKSKAVASIEKFSIEIDNDANIIDQAKLKEQKKQLKDEYRFEIHRKIIQMNSDLHKKLEENIVDDLITNYQKNELRNSTERAGDGFGEDRISKLKNFRDKLIESFPSKSLN